jgi:hypothetical protein
MLRYVEAEVFTAVTMKNAVFWDVASRRYFKLNPRFGAYRLHLQCRKIRERGSSVSSWQPRDNYRSSFSDFTTLKMKAICSSETSVQFTRSTRCHIPEDGILHNFKIIQMTLSLMRTASSVSSIRTESQTVRLPQSPVCEYSITDQYLIHCVGTDIRDPTKSVLECLHVHPCGSMTRLNPVLKTLSHAKIGLAATSHK